MEKTDSINLKPLQENDAVQTYIKRIHILVGQMPSRLTVPMRCMSTVYQLLMQQERTADAETIQKASSELDEFMTDIGEILVQLGQDLGHMQDEQTRWATECMNAVDAVNKRLQDNLKGNNILDTQSLDNNKETK